ncbi:nicotinate phosphoribosyltransferase [Phlegmacium glaucopus]|nr:nicotinate phosphoribosyltransferase [Phlegmacium glaucopus]
MQQAVLHHFPDIQAIYRFTNRSITTLFSRQCVERFRMAVSNFSSVFLTESELKWLRQTCPHLTPTYLAYLSSYRYKPEQTKINYIPVTWEVPLMACLSELYFQVVVVDWSYGHQDNIAYEKAKTLLEANCHFTELGTRPRRSYKAHDIIVKAMIRASKEVQSTGGFSGTSNVHLAHKYNLRPIGTIAHEWFMGVAALNDYKDANSTALSLWEEIYGDKNGPLIAVTDTFTTKCFLREFMAEPERAHRWAGVRHDSGDPFAFAPNVKAMYNSIGIGHESKTLMYSDALTIDKCLAIKKQCDELGFYKVSFGIGTSLTNDFRSLSDGGKSKPLDIVIKLSSVDSKPCVKLSDNPTKTTGDKGTVDLVKRIINL